MARPKKSPDQLTRNDPRWREFGRWLKWRREIHGVSVKKAAKATGISEKQWRRYETGESSVPKERMKKIAKVIMLTKGKVLMKAGYTDSAGGIDVEHQLRWLYKCLREGDPIGALEIFFDLHYPLSCGRKNLKLPKTGATATSFAKAVAAIDELPGWLCADLIKYLKSRQKDAEDRDYPFSLDEKSKFAKDVKALLAGPIQIGRREIIIVDHKISRNKVGAKH